MSQTFLNILNILYHLYSFTMHVAIIHCLKIQLMHYILKYFKIHIKVPGTFPEDGQMYDRNM